MFDDDSRGIKREPFITGADDIIEAVVKPAKRCIALFSATPFPGYTLELQWRKEENGGNWYYSPLLNIEGWFCPALYKYFSVAPATLYALLTPEVIL